VNPPKRAHNSEFTLKKQTSNRYNSTCTKLYKPMPFCFDSLPFWGASNIPAAQKVSAVLIRKLEKLIIKHHDSADH
jgi:hypothetical protein